MGGASRQARITERIARLRKLEGAARSATPPCPRSAKIELTSRCNYACRFCASAIRKSERADMPWSLYTRVARELRAAGVEQLGLFYIGESLLYDRLEHAVRYAKQTCGYPYVFLTTNGSLATAGRVRALMAAGLDSLKFALNFGDGEQLAQYAGVSSLHFEAVLHNMKDACRVRDELQAETGRRCTVSASSLELDGAQRPRMAHALAEIGDALDQHYWLPMYGRSDRWRAPGCKDAPTLSRKETPCWPLFTEAHVTVDGELSACGLDHAARFHVADLKAKSFLEAWHSAPFQALRAAHLAGDLSGTACAQCVGYED
jgi:hypothetical protein